MAFSQMSGSQKRTMKSHDPTSNNHPTTTRDSVANKQHDLELEQRCEDHIMSLRLSAEEDLSDMESFNAVDWLKEEAPCPPDVQRQVHRYMHANNLYQVSNSDDPIFVDLVDLVKSQAGVPNTRNWEQKVPDKCRDLINTSTRIWKRDGLLVARNNVKRKTEVFQYLWDSAIQAARGCHLAAQSIQRTFPTSELGNPARLDGLDSRKRSAESMQQDLSSSSPKRVRVAESDIQEDGGGDSIEVDCGVFYVTSPERDLTDENTRHSTALSAAAPSDGRHPTDGNIPTRFTNGLESTAMTARQAVSALGPAEEGRGSFQEGMQLSQKKMGPDFTTESPGYSAPAGCYAHENYQTNGTSWSLSHSNTISCGQFAATVEGLVQAASLKPIVGQNMNQTGSPSKEGLPSIRQPTNKGVMNMSVNAVGNNGHVISSAQPQEAENEFHNSNSNSNSRFTNLWLDNAPETSQAERTYYSLTAQIAAQVSQTSSPPNHQPSFVDRFQPSHLDQTGDGIASPGNPIIADKRCSPTPCENSGSLNCSNRVANAPRAAAYPQNSSQNGGNSQLPFQRRFSQSLNTTQTIAKQPPPPPPSRIDQSRDTESTRPVPSGLPPPQGSLAPPLFQNAWPNGPPPPPLQALHQSQGPPGPPGPLAPPIFQNAWPNGPPPPPLQALHQTQGPPGPPGPLVPPVFQNAWPPPPPRNSNQNQGSPGPPPFSPRNAWSNDPPPPPRNSNQNQGSPGPPPFSPRNAWPNGPPPPPRTLYQIQGPSAPPLHPVSTQNRLYSAPQPSPPTANQSERPASPPLPPPSIIPHYQRPSGPPPPAQCQNSPPSPAQGSPTSSTASTQHQSACLTDASDPVARPSPLHFPCSDQQEPSSSPWYLSQRIGQPTPAPTQKQPMGPPLTQSGSASEITFSNSTLPVAVQQSLETSSAMWKKYNEMVILHLLSHIEPMTPKTYRFLAGDVFKQTAAELFEWISNFLRISLPSKLVFEFINVHSIVERRMSLDRGNENLFGAMKTIAWQYFREIANLDPAVANIRILIIPILSAAIGSVSESMQQRSQQIHSGNTTSNVLDNQPSHLPVPNQNSSGIASDSVHPRSTTEARGPPPCGLPPPQCPNSFPISPAPDPFNSHGRSSNSEPSPMPTPDNKPPPEGNIPNSNNNMTEAHAPSNPDPQRPAKHPPPTHTKTNASTPSATKIVVRIQIDGHGRLSRSYDRSTLNTRISSTRFFAWFAHETGHAPSGTLRFDFKDALPAKSSVVAAGNEDHFELMVHDIKRKFERAKEFAPDMNEFCVVVTDPLWDSGDEDEDEDEDEDKDGNE